MLRGADNCRGCSLGPVCPVGPPPTPPPTVEPFTPLVGPACAAGESPCVGGTAVPMVGPAVCLSGDASPFGNVLDVLVGCGVNGTSSTWSLCAGRAKTGCGDCGCICRPDAGLTDYANNVIAEGALLTPTGACLQDTFLPGAINPLNLRLECRACN